MTALGKYRKLGYEYTCSLSDKELSRMHQNVVFATAVEHNEQTKNELKGLKELICV